MSALIIVISILVLLAFLRFGLIAEYSDEGFKLRLKAGFIKFELLKDSEEKPVKKKEKKKSSVNFKPGSLSDFMTVFKSVKDMLGRLKRRLLIRYLILYYVSAGDDPANTAIKFGASHAVFNTIVPALERNFRIKRCDLRAAADFIGKEQKIYAKAAVSLAVWEAFYIVFALFPIIKTIFKKRPVKNSNKSDLKNRKDGSDDGKSPDKRLDGNSNEKNEGTDRCQYDSR